MNPAANFPSQAASAVGGFLGDIIDGIKPDVIAGLGFSIQDRFGSISTPTIAPPTAPPPLSPNANEGQAPAGFVKTSDIVNWVTLGVVGFALYQVAVAPG